MLADLANVATIAEAIFVIISVLLIWLEVRQNTKLTRAANTQALVELASPFSLQLAQDRQLAELWTRGARQFAELDEIDQIRYRYFLFGSLTFHENIYYQRKNRLIDLETYESWRRSFEPFVQEHNLAVHWDDIKKYYQSEFAEYVMNLIYRDSSPPDLDSRGNLFLNWLKQIGRRVFSKAAYRTRKAERE